MPRPSALTRLVPGLTLAAAVALAGWGVAAAQARWLGHAVIEALVVAILLGMLVRTVWRPPAQAAAGVGFASRQLLEVAVLLLGASVDLPLLVRAGPALALAVVVLVVVGLAASYALGRLLGLPRQLAVLVAYSKSWLTRSDQMSLVMISSDTVPGASPFTGTTRTTEKMPSLRRLRAVSPASWAEYGAPSSSNTSRRIT